MAFPDSVSSGERIDITENNWTTLCRRVNNARYYLYLAKRTSDYYPYSFQTAQKDAFITAAIFNDVVTGIKGTPIYGSSTSAVTVSPGDVMTADVFAKLVNSANYLYDRAYADYLAYLQSLG